MRIIAGEWRDRDLCSPSGRVRPTAEEVRDTWIRELEPELAGARVLELYAGSGAVGLEALSRGAAHCDFVENSPSALHALKANIARLRVRNRVRIFPQDALRFIESVPPDRYEIVLADPPYGSRQLDRLIDRWLDAPFSTVLSVEHASDHRLPAAGEARTCGEATITTLRRLS